ncbi:hypothetical protein JRQ81_005204 [Phrynocephalus forsythii]|uniref:Coenzyme Q-binding protein COQ10 START domain-containing protein n=1 Tax=Phrynocephalus forsythii TaxID=171643 RepID=A0A9Q0XH21_9SAUR|nr:hypothetical protein JRQ81_005204 [Phrynocephalus forsythii]
MHHFLRQFCRVTEHESNDELREERDVEKPTVWEGSVESSSTALGPYVSTPVKRWVCHAPEGGGISWLRPIHRHAPRGGGTQARELLKTRPRRASSEPRDLALEDFTCAGTMAGSVGRNCLDVARRLLESGLRPRCAKGSRLALSPCRQLSCNRLFAPQIWKTCPRQASASVMVQQIRPFLNLAVPLLGAKKVEYAEVRRLPYSVDQMYDIVADVGSYQQFVPWCNCSRVISHHNTFSQAELEVGFPPVVERYVSEITLVPHRQIRAVSKDGHLFQHLETLWQFKPGHPEQLGTCMLKFYVTFEFKSVFHSQLANLFFNEVVKQMVSAFERRAEKLYGPQTAAERHKTVQHA